MNVRELLTIMQQDAVAKSRGDPRYCTIEGCGKATKNHKPLCSDHIEQSIYIKRLVNKVDSLLEKGYDDQHGKPINRVPEFFHLLNEGKSSAFGLMLEPHGEGGAYTVPRKDNSIAPYDKPIRQLRKRNNNRPKTGGRYPKGYKQGILVDSENPAYFLGDAA